MESYELLNSQLEVMIQYRDFLLKRARIEDCELFLS